MTEYRLHCFAQSGNAYKPALMLELAGADWAPVFVDFFNGAGRTPEFRALNPMGEVPVLEHDGQVLTQSGVILDYLAEKLGQFGPSDEAGRREILRWLLWDNHKLTAYNATWRFLSNFVPEEKRSADVVAFFEARARTAMGVLEAHLAGRDDPRRSLLRGLYVLRGRVPVRLGGRVSRHHRLEGPHPGVAGLETAL
jgi:glutathione S-transferase